ncbi:MAG: hypothetical protein IJT02_09435 [Synergistaceae bacterium]|nr:hypothetical protein [Synergistaceae bacterium]
MPFLRAALIRKKARPEAEEQEQETLLPPVIVVAEEPKPEPEPVIEEVPVPSEVEPVPMQEAESAEAEHVPAQTQEPEPAETEQEPVQTGETEAVQEREAEHVAEPVIEEVPELEPVTDTHEDEPPQEPEQPGQPEQPEAEEEPTEVDSGQTEETPEAVEEPLPEPSKDYSGSQLNYDFTSGERYVDSVSTKTEFDKMLDELAAISADLLAHEVEKFALKFTGKFQGDTDKAEADAKKFEAFLGGYITNAAMTLYDNGYRDAAIKRLEQARSILEARRKLEEETEAISSRVEENNDAVDLSDILGLMGD